MLAIFVNINTKPTPSFFGIFNKGVGLLEKATYAAQ